MTGAVLALQGAFAEHEALLHTLGIKTIELREKKDLEEPFDFLVLPGGESTVQGKLLKGLDMFDELKKRIDSGLPVFATCAGLILLAENIENDDKRYFQVLPVTVRRNAYGRQLGSHHMLLDFKGIGQIPATFIRAPYITSVSPEVEVLAKEDEEIVAVQYHHILALSFHPELDMDGRLYRYFLEHMAKNASDIASGTTSDKANVLPFSA